VKRGLVARPEDWKWSSLAHYAGMEGIVEIESKWTARKRERMGVLLVARAHPPAKGAGRVGQPARAHPPAKSCGKGGATCQSPPSRKKLREGWGNLPEPTLPQKERLGQAPRVAGELNCLSKRSPTKGSYFSSPYTSTSLLVPK